MQRVADAEGDAAHELRVDERGVHRAADVGARRPRGRSVTTPVSASTSSTTAHRAARIGDLRHLNEAPAASGCAAASSASVTRDPAQRSARRPHSVTSASATRQRAAARAPRLARSACPRPSARRCPPSPCRASHRCRRRSPRRRCRRGARRSGRRAGPGASPRIWASTVSRPGPIEDAPVSTTKRPSARASTCAVSNGPSPVFSTYTARPMPRRSRRARVHAPPARRARAHSPGARSSSSNSAGKSPES